MSRPSSPPPADVSTILEDALSRAELERLALEVAISWAVFRRLSYAREALSPGLRSGLDALERHTRKHPRRRTSG